MVYFSEQNKCCRFDYDLRIIATVKPSLKRTKVTLMSFHQSRAVADTLR